jgi:hypothetical protein
LARRLHCGNHSGSHHRGRAAVRDSRPLAARCSKHRCCRRLRMAAPPVGPLWPPTGSRRRSANGSRPGNGRRRCAPSPPDPGCGRAGVHGAGRRPELTPGAFPDRNRAASSGERRRRSGWPSHRCR